MPNERRESRPRPAIQQSIDSRQDAIASLVPLPAGTEQLVVVCVNVPNVGAHGECDRLGIEPLCIGTTTNTTRMLEAGMLRDRDRLRLGAPRVQAADVRGKLAAVVDVDFGIAFRASVASTPISISRSGERTNAGFEPR